MRTAPPIFPTVVLCVACVLIVQDALLDSRDIADGEAERTFGMGIDDTDLDADAAPRSLAGDILIARPGLDDPYFAGSVIYMLVDDEAGSLGVVLNDDTVAGMPIWLGGPVGRDRIIALHDDARRGILVEDGVAVATDPEVVTSMVKGDGPRGRLFFGYAGWGPGQLQREIDEGAWIIGEADASFVFDTQKARQLRAAIDDE